MTKRWPLQPKFSDPSDPPAFTGSSNLPNQVDLEFLAEVGSTENERAAVFRLTELERPRAKARRTFIVPFWAEVKAHSPEHARQIAAYCAKAVLGARTKIKVGEPRGL